MFSVVPSRRYDYINIVPTECDYTDTRFEIIDVYSEASYLMDQFVQMKDCTTATVNGSCVSNVLTRACVHIPMCALGDKSAKTLTCALLCVIR